MMRDIFGFFCRFRLEVAWSFRIRPPSTSESIVQVPML
jgi:hypothetical protein